MPQSNQVNLFDVPGGSSIRLFPKPTAQYKAIVGALKKDPIGDIADVGNPLQTANLQARQRMSPKLTQLLVPKAEKQSASTRNGGGTERFPGVDMNTTESKELYRKLSSHFLGDKSNGLRSDKTAGVAGFAWKGVKGLGRSAVNSLFGAGLGYGADTAYAGFTGNETNKGTLIGAMAGGMSPGLGRLLRTRAGRGLVGPGVRSTADHLWNGNPVSMSRGAKGKLMTLAGLGMAGDIQQSVTQDRVPGGVNFVQPIQTMERQQAIAAHRMAEQLGFQSAQDMRQFATKMAPYIQTVNSLSS